MSLMNQLRASQRVLWVISNRKESIHSWIDSKRCESIHLKSET